MSAKLLFLAGSARKKSLNKNLARAAHAIAVQNGAMATFVDLNDFPMPIYDGDLETENGIPEKVIELKQIFIEHNGLFIASPEYNSCFSPLLKNTLDWISRPHKENESGLSAYQGKVAAIASASPGGLGGIRGLVPLRMMLGNIAIHVIPDQLAIPGAFKAFDDSGKLIDEKQLASLTHVVNRLIATTERMNG